MVGRAASPRYVPGFGFFARRGVRFPARRAVVRGPAGPALASFVRRAERSASMRFRTFGVSFPPPVRRAAAVRAWMAFAGGFVGRAVLKTSGGAPPEMVVCRILV